LTGPVIGFNLEYVTVPAVTLWCASNREEVSLVGSMMGGADMDLAVLAEPSAQAPKASEAVTRQQGRLRSILKSPTARTIGRRLAMGVVLVLVVTGLSFLLVSLIPGDPARAILGLQATPEQIGALRRELGLDLPLYERYWDWLRGALQGDFGHSITSSQAVTNILQPRIGVTLSLLFGTLMVSVVVGVALGVASAVRGGALGRAVDVVSLVGFAIPSFWMGAMLASFFAVKLGWFPASGYVPITESAGGWLKSIALPVLTLSAGGVGFVSKQTRETMLEVLGSEYVRMARASGLSAPSIVLRHALKNASMRVLTVMGLVGVGVLGGTVVIETVFALPGLGGALVDATLRGDFPVVQAIVTYFAIMVVLINLIVDLAYVVVNPRVRVQ
jgi:peptide/nickel transport system permease protein